MSDNELKILFIAISAAFWSAAIIFGAWLFRQTENRQAKIVNLFLKNFLKSNIAEISEPAEFRNKRRMLQILLAANISTGISGAIAFTLFALFGLEGGTNSEMAKNMTLLLAVPTWLEAHLVWIVTLVVAKRILAATERRRILNDEIDQGESGLTNRGDRYETG